MFTLPTFPIGCNREMIVTMTDNVVMKYEFSSYLSGQYFWNSDKKFWIKTDDPFCGIWKDPAKKHWCVGIIYVSDPKNCNASPFKCDCQLSNPTIVNCPNEKMTLNWEHINENNELEYINPNDFQVQATLGQLHLA